MDSFDEQVAFIVLEASLVLGIIWLIFKKANGKPRLNLTEAEKDDIINAFEPESLEGEAERHYALKPRVVRGKVGKYINVDGIECLNFGSHDYLGSIGDSVIEGKVMKCIDTYGVGSCGPRGFYGTTMEHLELEKSLATFLGAEDALVYSYGFATVSSAIPAYAKKTDIIFVDEKRNFAIQKGLDASKSEIRFFKHNDVNDLEHILESVRLKDLSNMRKARRSRRFLIIEGIYINTGELCPLPELLKLCKKFKLRILLDESISFCVLGKTGRGITEHFDIPRKDVDLIMCSMEYALASVGGFCVGSRFLIDHQQISGQGYCYSAALPPLLATAALGALRKVQDTPETLVKLNKACQILHNNLNNSTVINNHFKISGHQDSPVHVLTLRDDVLEDLDQEITIDNVLESCLHKRVAVTRVAFIPGVDVSISTPCIRVTVSVSHTEEDVLILVQVLEDACRNVFFDYCKDLQE